MSKENKRFWYGYGLVILAWIAYVWLMLRAPLSANTLRYNLTPLGLRAVQLSVALPLLAVWLAAIYGAMRFKRYAELIADSPDGRALNLIASGLLVLVVVLVFSTLPGVILPYFANSPYLQQVIFWKNHLPMMASFFAFALMYIGSLRLVGLADGDRIWAGSRLAFVAVYAVLAGGFTWLFYQDPDRHVVNTAGVVAPHYSLSDGWLLLTIVLPYIIMWLLGCFAAFNVARYAQITRGSLYRKALQRLVQGLLVVIVFAVITQILLIGGGAFVKWSLAPLLLLVYALIVVDALAYLLIAVGARHLSKIEEVQLSDIPL